jgi:hypothetical protein
VQLGDELGLGVGLVLRMFYADILATGFVHGRNVDAADVDIPKGHVLVEIAAVEDDAGIQPGRLCANP